MWLLDRAKARLAWFLRKAKEENPSYVFLIHSAKGSWELNDEKEIEDFLEELSALPFYTAQYEDSVSQGNSEIYVFSTVCDTALPAFLLTQQSRPLSLFLVRDVPRENFWQKKSEKRKAGTESLLLRDFISGGLVPLLRWFPGRKRHLELSAGRMMLDYAETRL